MSTVSTPQPTAQRVPKNNKRLLFIFFAAVTIIFVSAGIQGAYQKFSSLKNEMAQSQLLLSQYQEHLQYMNQRLNYFEAQVFAKQEQSLGIKAKTHNHEDRLNRIEHFLEQQSLHSDANSKMKEQSLLKELKTHKEMYLQTQQKLQSYEQHLLALTQELKASREQNQLFKQEQAKMRAEHQEIIKKLSQTKTSQVNLEGLEKALESRLSQFVYADYELEQKVKDLQKAVESAAKVGELKALEVYYDDKINDLSNVIQNLPKSKGVQTKQQETVNPQVKQELAKLNIEKEEMKASMNNLWNHQRKNEERINLLEKTKQPEIKKTQQPEILKSDIKMKEKQQPKNVKQTQQNEEEPENIFELLQKMINEQSSETQEEPRFHPYMNHPFNRRNRPSFNQGLNHGFGNLFSYL